MRPRIAIIGSRRTSAVSSSALVAFAEPDVQIEAARDDHTEATGDDQQETEHGDRFDQPTAGHRDFRPAGPEHEHTEDRCQPDHEQPARRSFERDRLGEHGGRRLRRLSPDRERRAGDDLVQVGGIARRDAHLVCLLDQRRQRDDQPARIGRVDRGGRLADRRIAARHDLDLDEFFDDRFAEGNDDLVGCLGHDRSVSRNDVVDDRVRGRDGTERGECGDRQQCHPHREGATTAAVSQPAPRRGARRRSRSTPRCRRRRPRRGCRRGSTADDR